MAHSQLHVDRIVNLPFIAADERSTDHGPMTMSNSFADRLDEAVKAAGLSSRSALVAAIGEVENPKQTAGQWVKRAVVPHRYRKPLADLGISIDYVNDGEGALRLRPAPSHPVELQRQIIADTVTLIRHVEDSVLEPIPEDRQAELIEAATAEVMENWQGGLSDQDLAIAGRKVIARMRSGGR